MTLKQNIEAVLDCNFSETKDDIKETALNRILELIENDRNQVPNIPYTLDEVIRMSDFLAEWCEKKEKGYYTQVGEWFKELKKYRSITVDLIEWIEDIHEGEGTEAKAWIENTYGIIIGE